jgi:hypothetical protein
MTDAPHRWKKSSRSGAATNCVELAHTLDRVRDSKAPNQGDLTVTALPQLIRWARTR